MISIIFFSSIESSTDHLTPVLQVMVGRLYDRLGNFEQAIKYYSLGKFVCQSRVVTCLSKKYYAMALQSREEESFVDVSLFLKWAHNLSASVGLQVM